MGYEDFDDILLYQEDIMGEHLSKLDDRAIRRQGEAIRRARRYIPD